VQDFEKFTARAQIEELKRLGELEPLVVSSLQTLLVLCGADNVQEAAGAFHGHWNSLRMPLSFVQSKVRLRCWSDRTIFDAMVKLAQHSNPTIAHLVLNPVLRMQASGLDLRASGAPPTLRQRFV
jgi:hypothetical protein